jgi:hypothetical protein
MRKTRKPVRSAAGLPEPLSASNRNRVRKLSPGNQNQDVKHLPVSHSGTIARSGLFGPQLGPRIRTIKFESGHLAGAAYRNRTDDLRITRVFPCVAHRFKACASFMFAGCCRWPSLAVDGGSGASQGHAPVVRRPGSRWSSVVTRPSVFQAGHIPSWRGSCGSYALSLVAAVSGWLLLLLSPLLSAVGPGPHLRGLPGAVTAPCSAQTPPPNPIAAEPDGRRVLSRGGAADHAVTPKAPLTGSGCREHSYGGFGGGHSHFHPHAVFGSQPMVFKSVRGSLPATAATCLVGTWGWLAKQDHPVYIPRLAK